MIQEREPSLQKGMLGIPRKGIEIKTENSFILLSGSFLSLVVLAAQLKDFKQKLLRRVERSVLHERRINQIWNLDSGKDRAEGEACNRCTRKMSILCRRNGSGGELFITSKNTEIGVISWKDHTEMGVISSNGDAVISMKERRYFSTG